MRHLSCPYQDKHPRVLYNKGNNIVNTHSKNSTTLPTGIISKEENTEKFNKMIGTHISAIVSHLKCDHLHPSNVPNTTYPRNVTKNNKQYSISFLVPPLFPQRTRRPSAWNLGLYSPCSGKNDTLERHPVDEIGHSTRGHIISATSRHGLGIHPPF